MKKSKIFAGLLAGVCLLSSSTINLPATADKAAGQEYDTKGLDPESSAVKPTISLSRIDIPLSEAKENPVQKIQLRVDGAADKYAPTGFHIQWDNRLTLVPLDGKLAKINAEEAGKYLEGETQPCENGIFVATAASGNFGQDGVLWDFLLQLPEDISVGDKFDIEIAYKSKTNVSDLFNNRYKNEEGMLMQSWVFTHGIEHGYIVISDKEPSDIETTTSATTTTTTETTSSQITTTTAVTTEKTGRQTTNALGQKYDLKGLDPEQSPVKPTISLSRIKLPVSDAKENPVQKVKLSVEGAEYRYAPTGFHVQWDERLTLVPQDGEYAKLNTKEAGEYLKPEILPYTNGVFLSTSASANLGQNGVLWELLLQLPENVKAGDKYPVEIVYSAQGSVEDLFSDVFKNDEGMLMQAWVFTHGIEHGYIEITDDTAETTTSSTTSATTTTTTTTTSTTTTTKKSTTTTTTSSTTTTKKPTTTTTTSTTTTTKKPTTTTTTSTTTTTKKPTTTTTTSTTTTTKKSTTTTTTSTTTTTKKPTTTTTTSTTTTTKKPTTTTTTSSTTTTKKPTTTTTTSSTTTTKKPTTTTTTSSTTTTKKPTTTTTTSSTTTTKKPTTTTTTSSTTTTKKPTTTTTTSTTTTTKKSTTTTTTSSTTTTKKPTTTTTTSSTTTTKESTTTTSTSSTTTTKKSTTTTSTSTTSASTTTTIITRPVPKLGDATGDGWIDSVDASRILAIYAACSTGKREPDEKEYSICDVNFDKKIDSIDASIVLAYYAYTSTKEEIPFEDYLAKRS